MTVKRYDTRKEWLEDRRHGLGGSDMATILGMKSFTSKLKVFYDKTVEYLDPFDDDAATEEMEMGQDIEEFIIGQWSKRQAARGQVWAIDTDLMTITSDQYPFLRHSPDALIWENKSTDRHASAGMEVKNIGSDKGWDDPTYGGMPPMYYAQVQHGLLCSQLDRWEVAALVAGRKLITRTIFPDKEMMGLIALEGEKFWRDHVQAGFPPDPDGSDSAGEALKRQWAVSQPEAAVIPAELVEEYRRTTQALKNAEIEAETAKQRIQLEMGPAEIAKDEDDYTFATWKVGTRKAVDTKALKAEAPEVAEKFTKVTPTRVFRQA